MHQMFAPLCHAERSEASRSLTWRVLLAMNEILRFLRSLRMTLVKNLQFRVSRETATEKPQKCCI